MVLRPVNLRRRVCHTRPRPASASAAGFGAAAGGTLGTGCFQALVKAATTGTGTLSSTVCGTGATSTGACCATGGAAVPGDGLGGATSLLSAVSALVDCNNDSA